MEVKIVNLIIIRLFLKNQIYRYKDKGDGSYKPYSTYTPADWRKYVTEKLDLFLNHCLPSITAQTDQTFDCLVLVNKTFPEYSFVQEELEANQHLFQLEYVDFPWGDGYQDPLWRQFVFPLQEKINKYVKNKYPKCEWLLTQRLDSDDMICNDFMENVAAQFREKEEWIIFRNGYILIPTSDGKEYECYSNTSFVSMHHVYCEPFGTDTFTPFNTKEDIKTVYHRHHNKIGVGLHHGNANIIGSSRTSAWSKGYWLDFAGFSTNVARSASSWRGSRVQRRAPLTKDQLKDIKDRFTLSLEIKED